MDSELYQRLLDVFRSHPPGQRFTGRQLLDLLVPPRERTYHSGENEKRPNTRLIRNMIREARKRGDLPLLFAGRSGEYAGYYVAHTRKAALLGIASLEKEERQIAEVKKILIRQFNEAVDRGILEGPIYNPGEDMLLDSQGFDFDEGGEEE